MKKRHLFFIYTLFFAIACKTQTETAYETWEVYGGDKAHTHYSSLTQIDTANVSKLQVAWEYHTGDSDRMSQIQVNPIIIDTVLYGVSPKLKLFAISAATGKEIWTFKDSIKASGLNTCRGVTYYKGAPDDQRLFYGAGSFLYCINAVTGKPIDSFGAGGKIDLHDDLGRDVKNLFVAMNTPGIIYQDLIIIGDRVSEAADAAPGHIRAYDVHSGRLRWIFHTIPQPGEDGFETWDDSTAYKFIGGANSWAGFTLDEKKGMVYVPTGSASHDFYGGMRTGDNLFANCILALDAATGKRIWHFQTVHHDVWDRDLPTAPVLLTLTKNGSKIDALAQPTKSGFIFLFDRSTGEPLYPIKETPVPAVSELTGEKLSPTQPIPSFPEPFSRQQVTVEDLNRHIPDTSFEDIRTRLAGYKKGNLFTPPSKEGTILVPGTDGGAEWGGPGYDPETGILYINANEMPSVLTMVDADLTVHNSENNLQAGQRLYKINCMSCHGAERTGSGNYPTLIGVNKKYNEAGFLQLLATGRRMMPAFAQLDENEKKAIESFVMENKALQKQAYVGRQNEEDKWLKLPYGFTGYYKFGTKESYPAIAPPWGTINAINLNTGKIVWKETLGDYPELKAKGIHTGTANYGGPAVTAGGLVFIAATSDSKIRAFNKRTGALLWEADLPACGFATPSVYAVEGKQFLAIACGGGKLRQPSGDSYVAFALP